MKKIVDTFLNIKDTEYMFNNSIIVMDANILLSFYSYKEEHCDEVFRLLGGIENRLWIPYHTVNEFMKNRNKVIQNELNNLNTVNDKITKCLNKKTKQDLYENIYQKIDSSFKKEYVGEKRYSRINDLCEKLKVIEANYLGIVDKIDKERKDIYGELKKEKERYNNDTILAKLKDMYNGKVGEKYTHDKLVYISKEALEKTYYTILPGLSKEDLGKTTNVYGDYINYFSIIEYAIKEKQDIIYITNDSKEDWGYKINEKLEYHPTIYEDFYTRTNKNILMIPFDEFINDIDRYIDNLPELSDDTKKAINIVTSQSRLSQHMILKDISIQSEYGEISQAVIENNWTDSNKNKSDIFLVRDFKENIGKHVELMRSLDYRYFEGTLESVKIDIDPLIHDSPNSVLYLIKLKEYDEIFEINSSRIEYNTNYSRKYYFYLDGNPEWRIVFK